MDQSRESSFVYYLLSNASMNVYPQNKPQQFRTLLPTPLKLEGDWEVGLSTIIYPHNWNQLKFDSYISVSIPFKNIASQTEQIKVDTLKINFTYRQFTDIEELVRILNERVNTAINIELTKSPNKKSVLTQPHIYDHIEFALTTTHPRKLSLKNYGYNGELKITLPEKQGNEREMWRLLGIDDSISDLFEDSVGNHQASISLHFPSLYVYSPMIEYVGVGDTHAPLFAIVPIRGKIGEIVYERFEKPIYVGLNHNYIAEIEISIKDDTGEDVQFSAGKTILILHFRRRA